MINYSKLCASFRGKSNERILCKLSKSEILRLCSIDGLLIVHVAMETAKTSNFTCQSKSFISIFFTFQVSACELQSFFCHDLANGIHSQTAKAVSMYSHLKFQGMLVVGAIRPFWAWLRVYLTIINGELARRLRGRLYLTPNTHRHSKTAFALLYRHIYKAIFVGIAKH